jgi:hypothetical protein
MMPESLYSELLKIILLTYENGTQITQKRQIKIISGKNHDHQRS